MAIIISVLYGFYFFNVINLKFFTLTKILIRRSKTNFQAKSDHCKTNGFKHYVLPCSKKSNYLMCFSGVLEPKNPLRLHNDYLKGKQICAHSVPWYGCNMLWIHILKLYYASYYKTKIILLSNYFLIIFDKKWPWLYK